MKRLGVNIDHVATVRNARGSFHPDPVSIEDMLWNAVLTLLQFIYEKIEDI